MNRRHWIIVSMLMTAGLMGSVGAQEPDAPLTCPICRRANNQNKPYHQKAGITFLRGATNTAFGWTELLLQPTAEVERGGNLAVGVGKGVGSALKRTAVGLGELFTCWLPKGKHGYVTLSQDCPICMRKP